MASTLVNAWEVGQFRLEEHHSAGRGTSFELMEAHGSYRLTIFPHELHHLEALLSDVRAAQRPALVGRRHA